MLLLKRAFQCKPPYPEKRGIGDSTYFLAYQVSCADVSVTLQALGISTAAAQRILDSNAGGKPTFIPQGNLGQMLNQAPSLPVQFPKLIHRYPLLQNTHEVSKWGHHMLCYCCSTHTAKVVVKL
jgi:hypothetical protein